MQISSMLLREFMKQCKAFFATVHSSCLSISVFFGNKCVHWFICWPSSFRVGDSWWYSLMWRLREFRLVSLLCHLIQLQLIHLIHLVCCLMSSVHYLLGFIRYRLPSNQSSTSQHINWKVPCNASRSIISTRVQFVQLNWTDY